MANVNPKPMVVNQAKTRPRTRPRKRKQKFETLQPVLFILDPSNVKSIYQNPLVKNVLYQRNFNHKVIIKNTSPPSGKLHILQAIIKQVKPHILVPLEIQCINNNIEFFCAFCGPALNRLCDNELLLNFEFKDGIIKLPVTLMTCVRWREDKDLVTAPILRSMLKSRITSTEPKTMNLEKFDKLAGMQRLLYLDLGNPIYLGYVLNILKNVQPKILNLSDNNIVSLKEWKMLYRVEAVDLSYNQIKSFEDLGVLLRMDLKKINLSYNPIQDQFSSNEEFKNQIKKLFPNAEIILESKPKPSRIDEKEELVKTDILSSFVISESASYLVDQFMEHFFNYYDNPKKRRYLQDMYHSDAIFSLTSTIRNESENTICPGSQRYKHHAHNLLNLKSRTDYVIGPLEIIRKLCYLPSTEHDPRTFSVDVLHYTENKSAMFVINGAFQEKPVSGSPYYFFTRNFVLTAGEYGEFKIINDLLFVSNDQHPQIKPFKNKFYETDMPDITDRLPLPLAVKKDQKDGTLAIFIEITTLHAGLATDYLEKAQWNLRKALEKFVHDLRFDFISSDCFMQEEQRKTVFKHLPSIEPGINREKLGKMLENLKNLKDEKYLVNHKNKKLFRSKILEIRKMLYTDT